MQWSIDLQKKAISELSDIGKVIFIKADWSGKFGKLNLLRLYKSGQNDEHKIKMISKGEFLIVIVEDRCMNYKIMETTTSKKNLNQIIVEKKNKLRKLSKTMYSVHSTDDLQESLHAMWILFGFMAYDKGIDQFLPATDIFDKDQRIHLKTHGIGGWRSYEDFFYTLAVSDQSIVINKRGALLLLGDKNSLYDRTHDIDLLTKDKRITNLMISAYSLNNFSLEFPL